ncbi:MAG: alpha/beta fold hydrolase [Proteobacteria bacterium]|nr:alpha/beta fold hydrolase [Pseudomonadota bacterium]
MGAAFERFCTPVQLERKKSSSARFEPLSLALPLGTLKGFAAGPADGPPVLLVHGWNAQAEFFAPLALALTRQGLRVYAFDMPAHGQTRDANPDRPTTNMPEWVAAMMGVTRHLGIACWRGVVAHSFGALASSFAFGPRPWSDAPPLASDAAVFIAAAAGMPTVIESYLSVATVSEAEIADIIEGVERISRAPLAAVTVGAVASSLPAHLMIVHDPADTMTRPADLAYELASRPDRTVLERPGAGHDGILFQLEVGRAVAKFLA